MNKAELLQRMLIDATQRHMNTHAELSACIRRLMNMKEEIIESAVIGKKFDVKELDPYLNIKPANTVKAVAVETTFWDASLHTAYGHELVSLYIFFMSNPNEILTSKAQLTDAEERILKEMKEHYENKFWTDETTTRMRSLNDDLHCLKHGYCIKDELSWAFSFEEMTDPDFINKGLSCRDVTIVGQHEMERILNE